MADFVLPSEVTVYQVADLQAQLIPLFENGYHRLEVDASQVEILDTAGTQLLLSLWKEARARGRTLGLLQPSAKIQATLRLIGIAPNFDDLATSSSRAAQVNP